MLALLLAVALASRSVLRKQMAAVLVLTLHRALRKAGALTCTLAGDFSPVVQVAFSVDLRRLPAAEMCAYTPQMLLWLRRVAG
jgi:hypothetical protein